MQRPNLAKHIEPVLTALATPLAKAGASAPALTLVGFAAAIGAVFALRGDVHWAAFGLFAVTWLAGGLAAPLSMLTYGGKAGVFLDGALMPLASAALVLGFALADPARALAAIFLLLAFAVVLAVLAAMAKIGARVGTSGMLEAWGPRGWATGAVLLLACAMPEWFSIVAYAAGVMGFLAAGMLAAATLAQFRGK